MTEECDQWRVLLDGMAEHRPHRLEERQHQQYGWAVEGFDRTRWTISTRFLFQVKIFSQRGACMGILVMFRLQCWSWCRRMPFARCMKVYGCSTGSLNSGSIVFRTTAPLFTLEFVLYTSKILPGTFVVLLVPLEEWSVIKMYPVLSSIIILFWNMCRALLNAELRKILRYEETLTHWSNPRYLKSWTAWSLKLLKVRKDALVHAHWKTSLTRWACLLLAQILSKCEERLNVSVF